MAVPVRTLAATGNTDKDTANWTAACASTAAAGELLQPVGAFQIRASNTQACLWHSDINAPVYISVPLVSGMKVDASKATFKIHSPVTPYAASNPWVFLFGTALGNTDDGDVDSIEWSGGTFDFDSSLGIPYANTYVFGGSSVNNWKIQGVKIINSSAGADGARGRLVLIENCNKFKMLSCTFLGMSQAIYARYSTGVELAFNIWDDFREAIDFDGPCWDVHVHHNLFYNGNGEAQCIDTGGGSRWMVNDNSGKDVGNVFLVYLKDNAWQTYAEWYADSANTGTNNPIIPDDMTFCNNHFENAGIIGGVECFRIGNYRDGSWPAIVDGFSPAVGRVVVKDFSNIGGNMAAVNECADLVLQDIYLEDTACLNDTDVGAALVIRQSSFDATKVTDSVVSGSATGIKIKNAHGCGVIVSAPSGKFHLQATVDGYNTSQQTNTRIGVNLTRLATKNGRFSWDLDVKGGLPDTTPLPPVDLNISGTTANTTHDYSMEFVRRPNLASILTQPTTVPILVTGDVTNPCQKLVRMREINVPSFAPDATGISFPVYQCVLTARAFWGYTAVVPMGAIAGDAVNYSGSQSRYIRGGAASSLGAMSNNIDNAVHIAGALLEQNAGALPTSGALLLDADAAVVQILKVGGAGSTVPPLRILAGLIEFGVKA